jgi:hypothetical protein
MLRLLALSAAALALTGAAPMPQDEDAIAALATRAVIDLCPMLLAGQLDLRSQSQAEYHGFGTDKLGERFAFSVGTIPDRVIIARGLTAQECTIGLNAGRHPSAFAKFRQNLVDAGFSIIMDKPSTVGGNWGYDRAVDSKELVYRVAIMKFEDQSLITAFLFKPKKKKP